MPTADVKPGASVLATISDFRTTIGLSRPLVVQRFGLGRTAALMLGDLWRWGMQGEAPHKDLDKFWRQLVRWLVSDVPARVAVNAETGADGDPARVRLVVKVRDEEYKPLDNAAVQLTIRPVPLSQGAPVHDLQLTADASPNQPGTYVADYTATEPGACTVGRPWRRSQTDGKVVLAGLSAVGPWARMRRRTNSVPSNLTAPTWKRWPDAPAGKC